MVIKRFLYSIILALSLFNSCQRAVNHGEKCGIEDTIYQPHSLVLKYDSSLLFDTKVYHNLELRYGDVIYRDSIHYFDFSYAWNSRGPEDIRVWSNGKRTTFLIPIVSREANFLILQYRGSRLLKSMESVKYFNYFLNDIDMDGYAEVGTFTYIAEEPIFVDDTIECDILGSKYLIYRITDDTILIDSLLTNRATMLTYSYVKDTIILEQRVSLVAYKEIDLQNYTLSQLENK